ncbi:MAG: hypothetical protein MUP11_08550 [Anaerolineales bacterium]|nr:hypothetical protein [Anaerolineales bacterium]
MKIKTVIKRDFIAPCGMNCALCMARLLREKDQCPGCRGEDALKPKSCVQCVIVNCEHFKETDAKYCSTRCEKFPCRRLKDLDKRYRTKYHMSMLENLKSIEDNGIRAFVRNEKVRWSCPDCGGILCVHRDVCVDCGKEMGWEEGMIV